MEKKALLIDGNSIGWASQHGTVLTVGDMQTQAILGVIQTMRKLCIQYPGYEMIVLWDGKAKWRFDLLPTYKDGREDTPQQKAVRSSYADQKPLIMSALKMLGIRQLTAFDREADDLAGTLTSKFSKLGYEIVLITGDRDWLQLLRPGVSWRDMREDTRRISLSNFKEKTGFETPIAFLQGKCLQGDTSDAIPGVGRIGEKRSVEVLETFGSVQNFWKKVDDGSYVPKHKHLIELASKEGRRRFGVNLKLMQLIKQPPLVKDQTKLVKGEQDFEAFRDLCEELMFRRILTGFGAFIAPFKVSQQ